MPKLTDSQIDEAAGILWSNWAGARRIDALPPGCRPHLRADGYAIQAAIASAAGQPTVGWKIAATSVAGQRHIEVDGPLAGRLHANRVLGPGSPIPFVNSLMKVAEAEFCFRLGASLPPRDRPYGVDEVMEAVATAHPSIETPDSRFEDFARVGAPQLIADTACAAWLAIGPAFDDSWRSIDLAAHTVEVTINGHHARSGIGRAALGDPRIALTWIANELSGHGIGLEAGEYVTTGTCIVPAPIASGDSVTVDYGVLGTFSVVID
ncbi:MAG: fumarylacetoacetate hydrolase family protein [Bauldia sp.]